MIELLRKIAELERRLEHLETAETGGALVDISATSTITGWSAYTAGYPKIFYKHVSGKLYLLHWDIRGTGSGTTASFTIPFTVSAATGQTRSSNYSLDNATSGNGWGYITAGGSTVGLDKDAGGTNWSNGVARICIGEMLCVAA